MPEGSLPGRDLEQEPLVEVQAVAEDMEDEEDGATEPGLSEALLSVAPAMEA